MASSQSDVYAFGIMLWEIATSRVPYEDVSGDKARYIRGGGRPKTTGLSSDKAALVPIMTASWDASPARRPTMAKILQMLQVLLISLAIPAVDFHSSFL